MMKIIEEQLCACKNLNSKTDCTKNTLDNSVLLPYNERPHFTCSIYMFAYKYYENLIGKIYLSRILNIFKCNFSLLGHCIEREF